MNFKKIISILARNRRELRRRIRRWGEKGRRERVRCENEAWNRWTDESKICKREREREWGRKKRERERAQEMKRRDTEVTKDAKIQKKNRYICDCDFRRETLVCEGVDVLPWGEHGPRDLSPLVDRRDESLTNDPDSSISYDRSSSLSPLPRQPDRAWNAHVGIVVREKSTLEYRASSGWLCNEYLRRIN